MYWHTSFVLICIAGKVSIDMSSNVLITISMYVCIVHIHWYLLHWQWMISSVLVSCWGWLIQYDLVCSAFIGMFCKYWSNSNIDTYWWDCIYWNVSFYKTCSNANRPQILNLGHEPFKILAWLSFGNLSRPKQIKQHTHYSVILEEINVRLQRSSFESNSVSKGYSKRQMKNTQVPNRILCRAADLKFWINKVSKNRRSVQIYLALQSNSTATWKLSMAWISVYHNQNLQPKRLRMKVM